jgi:hypothetical protein
MVTGPPGPVYPVMVIAPLLVVKVNWACSTAGSANSSSSGSNLGAQAVLKRPATAFGLVVFPIKLFVLTFLPFRLAAPGPHGERRR